VSVFFFYYKGGKMAKTSSNTDLHGYGEAIRRELRRRIPRDRKVKVLDVGTGFGINVGFLASWLHEGSEIWSVDPSQEVVADVRARLDEKEMEDGPQVRFAVGSAEDLHFEDASFDYVVSVMVLHHIERLQPALGEMARVLKPGGALLIVDYKPEASHKLEFTTRHYEEDFAEPEAVVRAIGERGLAARSKDHGVWYLVEAKKKRVEASARPAARSARPRPRAAR
jgi:ubiquinone/menaquinone biosynthesis C-methylase UbiE